MRRVFTMFFCSLLLGGLLVALPATGADAAAAVKLTVSPAHPVKKETFVVSGTIPGSPVVRPVELQQQSGKKWKKVAGPATTTDETGAFTFTTSTTSAKVSLRVYAAPYLAADVSYPAFTSATSKVTTAAQSIKLTLPALTTYKQATATFTASPARSGRTVVLQHKVGKTWQDVASTTQGTSTKLTVAFTPPASGKVSFRAQLAAFNGAPAVTSKEVKVTVKAGTKPAEPLVIPPASLPHATPGIAYDATITITGGTGPFTWQATGLPEGLTLEAGTITGTTTAAGTFPVVLTVTDKAGRTASVTLDLSVVALEAEAVTAGGGHTCALTDDGAVWCWGDNQFGQVGDGTTTDSRVPAEVIGSDASVTSVSAGANHTCAVLANGVVKCWGENSTGQLGDGTTANSPTPVTVQGLSGVAAVAAGDSYTCALTTAGAVWCWGKNDDGQVGQVDPVDPPDPCDPSDSSDPCEPSDPSEQDPESSFHTPQLLMDSNDVPIHATGISAGSSHACAIVAGAVDCWGSNATGQLGFSGESSAVPVPIAGLTDVTAIAAGGHHTCAVASGTVRCWGKPGDELGGTPPAGQVWVETTGLGTVTAVASGGQSSCALTDTSLYCWGNNTSGQLGDGTTVDQETPVAVVGLASPAVTASAGLSHTCAVLSDGGVRCWGSNLYGRLGDGTTDQSSVPRSVVGFK
jgi:alpha-tubulin suppressor-like RCC1 family protein